MPEFALCEAVSQKKMPKRYNVQGQGRRSSVQGSFALPRSSARLPICQLCSGGHVHTATGPRTGPGVPPRWNLDRWASPHQPRTPSKSLRAAPKPERRRSVDVTLADIRLYDEPRLGARGFLHYRNLECESIERNTKRRRIVMCHFYAHSAGCNTSQTHDCRFVHLHLWE